MSASISGSADILPRDLFANKTVFVTGGGSGINLGIAHSFARLGAAIAICGRSQDKLDNAATALRASGAEHEFRILPGGHDWDYWATRGKFLTGLISERSLV